MKYTWPHHIKSFSQTNAMMREEDDNFLLHLCLIYLQSSRGGGFRGIFPKVKLSALNALNSSGVKSVISEYSFPVAVLKLHVTGWVADWRGLSIDWSATETFKPLDCHGLGRCWMNCCGGAEYPKGDWMWCGEWNEPVNGWEIWALMSISCWETVTNEELTGCCWIWLNVLEKLNPEDAGCCCDDVLLE